MTHTQDTSCPVPMRNPETGGLTDCDKPLYIEWKIMIPVDSDFPQGGGSGSTSKTGAAFLRDSSIDAFEIVCENGHVVDSGGWEMDGRTIRHAYRSAQVIGGVR